MQQGLRLADVADMPRCANDGMHQTRVRIDANMRLHAEVPLIAASALVHVRVARASLVLG